jgi:MFS family permease
LAAGAFTLFQFLVPLWVQALGASPATLGLIVGTGSLLPTVLTVPAGALIDRRGARSILAVAALLAGAAGALYPLASDYWWVLPVQLAAGLGRTIAWVGAQAYLIQVTPSAALPRRTAVFGFAAAGGNFVTPIVGGILIDAAGYGAAFGFGAAAYALLTAITLMLPTPTLATGAAPPGNLWTAYRRAGALLLRAGMALLLLGTVLRLAVNSIRNAFWPLYLLEQAIMPATIGLLFGAGNLCGVLATATTGRLQPWLGAGPLLFLALGGSAAAILLTPTQHGVWPLALLGLLWGIGIAITLPPLMTLVAQSTRPAERGLGTALRNTGNEWSIMLSPVIFGFIAERAGLAETFAISGSVLLLVAGAGLLWARRLG